MQSYFSASVIQRQGGSAAAVVVGRFDLGHSMLPFSPSRPRYACPVTKPGARPIEGAVANVSLKSWSTLPEIDTKVAVNLHTGPEAG